jgi:hypothetical protein
MNPIKKLYQVNEFLSHQMFLYKKQKLLLIDINRCINLCIDTLIELDDNILGEEIKKNKEFEEFIYFYNEFIEYRYRETVKLKILK